MKENKSSVDILFVLLLFTLFTATAVATVLIGIKIYRYSSDGMDTNYETRTASSYLMQKVRAGDVDGGVTIQNFDGIDTLAFEEIYDTTGYFTYLYVYDGYLRELTIAEESAMTFDATAGQKVVEAEDMTLDYVGNDLIAVSYVTGDGQSRQLYLSTKCGNGGAYE